MLTIHRVICQILWGTLLFAASAQAADSSGRFIQPKPASAIAGPLLVSVQAQDTDGLARVFIRNNQNPHQLELCPAVRPCAGNDFSATLGNIDPATFGVSPGLLQLQLWVTDNGGNSNAVDSVSVNWQPPGVSNLKAQRSADGVTLNISWDPAPGVLRYNLYLASVSGVNRSNYRQLPDGQARLAVKDPAEKFSGLNPAKAYYLLVTAIKGSGESILAGEILIPTPQAPNQPPQAVADNYRTIANVALQVDAAKGLLANDTDPDNDALRVNPTPLTAPQSGTLTLATDGSFRYVPNQNFNGTDNFVYQVSDGKGGSAQATVSIVVTAAPNNPPVAVADSYSATSNQTLQVSAAQGVLSNDTDPDNDALTVNTTPLTPPQSGTLTLAANGSFSYVPNQNFTGTDSFTYQITDGKGATAQATASLQVNLAITNITGNSLNMTGEFLYVGQGEDPAGSQIGTGLYRIGDCIQLVDTRCSMQGRYVEAAQSGHVPGQQGNYTFVMSYPGVAATPVLARSVSANSNSLQFIATGQARFELSLFPDSGGKFSGVYPATPFNDSLNFGAFIQASASCSGLPAGLPCSIGQVGRVAGAQIQAPLDRLSFTIPGSALDNPGPVPPTANADQYAASAGQTLNVAAPGILTNDLEAKALRQGNQLAIRHSLNPGLGSLVGLSINEYQQDLYLYPAFAAAVQLIDRLGVSQGSLPMQGEPANDVDLDITAQAFVLKDSQIPQGSLLIFNGETNATEIYAVNPATGALLARLDTAFGASHVVGGAYNPVSRTLWLLQDNVPAAGVGNVVAQIDPITGQVLSSFNLLTAQHSYGVSFGDLHINPNNGNILLVSSIQSAMAEFDRTGKLVRLLSLPAGVSSISGLAVSADGARLWLASTNGEVHELGFANQGVVPTLTVALLSGPANGSVILRPDGSFSYTPNGGFSGQDSFTYQLSGAFGGISQNTVVINVQ